MKKIILNMVCLTVFIYANEQSLSDAQIRELKQNAMREAEKVMMQTLLEAANKIKNSQINQTREELLSNLSSTAPRGDFIVNADVSSDLTQNSEDFSGSIYVSTDNQASWTSSSNIELIGTEGYENTWAVTTPTSGGANVDWYLGGLVNSETLGLDYGTLVVSQAPNNVNDNFPPGANLTATIIDDPADASSGQDILNVLGTYSKSFTNEAINKVYLSMDLSGDCCDPGSISFFFGGTLYLYGIGILNIDNLESIYAVAYGDDGGYGQLSSGLMSLDGDLTGEDVSINGLPAYITDNIQIDGSGNTLNLAFNANDLFEHPDFGEWPNSLNGLVLLGVTVEAYLPTILSTPEISIADQTGPGFLILGSQHQEGNMHPILSSPEYDNETNTLSVTYTDTDGNLPWRKNVALSQNDEFITDLTMIPNSHAYKDGVVFSTNLDVVDPGDYLATFSFSDNDDDFSNIEVGISVGGGFCSLAGDINANGNQNVQDIILMVQLILGNQYELCADMNLDDTINIQDIILLVNAILDI